ALLARQRLLIKMSHPRADDRIIAIQTRMYGRIESAVEPRNDALTIARHDKRFRRALPPLDERSVHGRSFVVGYDLGSRSLVLRLSRLDRILLRARWEKCFANDGILKQVKQVRDTTPEIRLGSSSQSGHEVMIGSAAISPVLIGILSAYGQSKCFAHGIVDVKPVFFGLNKWKRPDSFVSILRRRIRQHRS